MRLLMPFNNDWQIGWHISTSLYRARNVRVTTIMEDMVDFFTY